MNREAHVRFCESVEVKLPRATHQERQECNLEISFLALLAYLAVQSSGCALGVRTSDSDCTS
jgi:hypothetical protein